MSFLSNFVLFNCNLKKKKDIQVIQPTGTCDPGPVPDWPVQQSTHTFKMLMPKKVLEKSLKHRIRKQFANCFLLVDLYQFIH